MLVFRSAQGARHPLTLLLVLSMWLATVGNLPLWWAVWRLPETHGWRSGFTLLCMVLSLFSLTLMSLSLLVWPRWLKATGWLFLVLSASASYFMWSYGIVIDSSMVANITNTDVKEAADLMSWKMLPALVVGVLLPGWWWTRQRVLPVGWSKLAPRQLGVALFSLLVLVVVVWSSFQDLASLMRNHKSLRYMMNPFNSVYAVGRHAAGTAAQAQQPLTPIGEDAKLRHPVAHADEAPLFVLVVGETARAANVGLGGYARDTTPGLKALAAAGELTYFTDVTSCGTNTQTSLPCMFSHLGREAYLDTKGRYENLVDVLHRAGLAVVWLDNQSGCKGLCDRIPNVGTRTLERPQWCEDGECLDEVMLATLPEQLEKLDPARRARGTVVVMHQMGSHGPAYHKRSPKALKVFQPECTSAALQECTTDSIVNAYDNSIRYTDHFLSQTVAWLKQQSRPTAMLYLSDHGESLGESGLFLHGLPYGLAPDVQKKVPMALWLSREMRGRLQVGSACLEGQRGQPWTHDHLFHTVLSLTQVSTSLYKPALDVLGPCLPR